MVKVKEDLTDKTFGRLTVIQQVEDQVRKDGRHVDAWLCICECGNYTIVRGNNLKAKKGVKSCGCLALERLMERSKKANLYDLTNEYGIGYTNNTGECFYFSLEDYDAISKYCWHEVVKKTGYRILKAWDADLKREITMAELLGCKHWDHKNRNTLDNRRENLRPATPSNNAQNRTKQKNNTSGIIGISWNKRQQQWVARIGVNGTKKNLGSFANKTDAIRARLKAEKEYHGEFAPQRHLFADYNIC